MSEGRVELLFDEFATRYRRGERPDVLEYLERAGEEREALAGLVDRFLEAVPARAPSEEEVVRMQALVQRDPPLLVLRLRRRLTREAVVSSLVKALGLDPAKSEKVGGYYHRLEVGILDPDGVDRSVWDVLADLFAANARALAPSAPEPPAASAVAFMREPSAVPEESVEIPAAAAPAAEEPDEVDRLFTAGA